MSSSDHCFVEWKEEFVSQERGNRLVHYFLKTSAGNSILAVVGTERSVRHMFYVVTEEFMCACGGESSAHAGFKWRSRREVVDWLTSMLSKQHVPRDQSRSSPNNTAPALGSGDLPMSSRRSNLPDYMGRLARDVKVDDPDIVWSGAAWTCGKQLKHYPAFRRNGTKIAIQSFVFVMAKDKDRYLAYLEDMYEDRKKQKKVKVRWFHHNQELKGAIHLCNSHPKEVLITHYAQVISAECVDGPATVLTPEHYDKCMAAFPPASLERLHVCFRQFRNNKAKPFDLSKLRGYFDQPDLLCLDPSSACHHLVVGEEEELSTGETLRRGGKRTRSCRGCQSQMMICDPVCRSLPYDFSGRRLLPINGIEPRLWHTPFYNVDQKIELLCQDSGIRGCWFRCTVLQVSGKRMQVQYDDVLDEDGCGNLKEWIPAFRLAMPDKLGMRCSDRTTIRPCPPNDQMSHDFDFGSAVDVWWSDGWWEGIVIGINDCDDDTLEVYLPAENIKMQAERKKLRISRDWVGGRWVDVKAKPDISDALSAAMNGYPRFCRSSDDAMVNPELEDKKLDDPMDDGEKPKVNVVDDDIDDGDEGTQLDDDLMEDGDKVDVNGGGGDDDGDHDYEPMGDGGKVKVNGVGDDVNDDNDNDMKLDVVMDDHGRP